jgi:membrane-bound lytic murein transglycosylase D
MNMSPLLHFSCRRITGALGLALTLWLAGCATSAPEPVTVISPPASTSPPPVSHIVSPPPPLDERPISLNPNASLGLTATTDIWERIRRGFAMPNLDDDLVRNREKWYASRPDYILRMTERSRPYLFHIVQELERRQMPTELALLPFIESAFNPYAVSSAKAAGMWQFMPATGKYFDLKQNLFHDERRDVLESTRAALDYLQKLYGMFGDWHLALAAYNWGEGSVGRALARNKAQGKPLTYSALNMPNETRYYVPKLQAVKNIVAQPEAFNTQLPLIQNHPFFKSVPIDRDMDVAVAVQLAGISLEDFKALNPSMNRPVILASSTPQVLLPWDNATTFEINLQNQAQQRLATWTAWQAPRTMKAEEAAALVDMNVAQLRSANGIPNNMMVKAGSTLLVHRKGQLDSDVSESIAANAQLALAPQIVLKRIMVTARKGDSLASLAARHGVSAANMIAWNKIKPNATLTAGQSLAVMVPFQSARTGTGAGAMARKRTTGAAHSKPGQASQTAKR